MSIGDNGGPDVAAWDAITSAGEPAGTGNTVLIRLRAPTKKAGVETVDGEPSGAPAPTR